ncbi:unnamed protein product [Angiostrongylus costaricensis]|uniref:Mitochondrial carrier protein n=1 Tax=Angiostrongylus costaricensis TaxID=334426 RepID=A0A0R3PT17_ANGCS|nr:unnamed protein product [Angiostrongylus costaricensis]
MYADFIAGWAAGGAGLLVGYPLDTVKTRLQTIVAYKGIVDCFVQTVRQESIYGLYKGVSAPLLSAGVVHSLLFTGYGVALRLLHPGESHLEARKDLPISEILFASTCGTIAQVIPIIPIELLKTRLQVQREGVSRFTRHASVLYSGPIECARQIVKKEGIRGLFKGGKLIFFRDVIGYIFYIPVYELTLRFMRTKQISETTSQLFSGGCAGVCGWLSVCPLEVIKTRIQAENTARKMLVAKEMAREMWNEAGARSFYRGGLALSMRGFVVNAVVFLVYENVYKTVDNTSTKLFFA